MGEDLGKEVSVHIFAGVITTPLQFVQIIIAIRNTNFLDMSDNILEWEATQPLEKVPLNLRIIGIRYLKDVIHYIVNNVHSALVFVVINGFTCPLLIWVLHGRSSVGGTYLPGVDLIIDSNGMQFYRLNRTLCFVLRQNVGIV